MMVLRDFAVQAPGGGATLVAVEALAFSSGRMHAIIGPSGCGKTSLLKGMIGLLPSTGSCRLRAGGEGDGGSEADGKGGRVGFAPQFTVVPPLATVDEALDDTLRLTEPSAGRRRELREAALAETGLTGLRGQRASQLSGGQRRRLGLALELVSGPDFLLCDEVTSGLDPTAERQMLAVLRQQVEGHGRTVVCIIHNLARVVDFDVVTVLFGGRVVFQGSPEALMAHFGLGDIFDLYEHLVGEAPAAWADGGAGVDGSAGAAGGSVGEKGNSAGLVGRHLRGRLAPPSAVGLWGQTLALLRRRGRFFWRDKGYLGLTLAITLGFPLLVVIFALDGLPEIERLALVPEGSLVERQAESLRLKLQHLETGQLVTSLIMFQVILLTLMGSNNGAREIAAERVQWEKERLVGLRPLAYLLSKAVTTGLVAAGQGAFMAWFVKVICHFPGELGPQMVLLSLLCVSMSWVCLGFSAVLGSAEKASLLSVYLVGFQLPLSGVVLALPAFLVWVCRPIIAAYWGWSGYLVTMRDSPIYDAWAQSQVSAWPWLPTLGLAAAVLALQGLAGLGLAWWGCCRRQHVL